MRDFNEFVMWESSTRDTIDVKRAYIDMVEDLVTGILLSQIVYYYLPSFDERGRMVSISKLRVKKEGEMWIAKLLTDWWDECRITKKQAERALKILVNKDIITKGYFRFNGLKTMHIRLNKEVFFGLLASVVKKYNTLSDNPQRGLPVNPKGGYPSTPKGATRQPQRGLPLTKNTTKNTTENTTKSLKNKQSKKQTAPTQDDKPISFPEKFDVTIAHNDKSLQGQPILINKNGNVQEAIFLSATAKQIRACPLGGGKPFIINKKSNAKIAHLNDKSTQVVWHSENNKQYGPEVEIFNDLKQVIDQTIVTTATPADFSRMKNYAIRAHKGNVLKPGQVLDFEDWYYNINDQWQVDKNPITIYTIQKLIGKYNNWLKKGKPRNVNGQAKKPLVQPIQPVQPVKGAAARVHESKFTKADFDWLEDEV
jgi:hypothetical protein